MKRREVEIVWPDSNLKISMKLLDKKHPKICEKFWESLPFETFFISSMSAGEMLKAPLPFSLPLVQDDLSFVPSEDPGSVFAMETSLIVKYGIIVEPFYLPLIGKIPSEDLERLKDFSITLRDAFFFTKRLYKAIVRRK